MTWNFRLIRHHDRDGRVTAIALHEVYYDAHGNVRAYTERPVSFIRAVDREEVDQGCVDDENHKESASDDGCSDCAVDDLIGEIANASRDAERLPVLDARDLPGYFDPETAL